MNKKFCEKFDLPEGCFNGNQSTPNEDTTETKKIQNEKKDYNFSFFIIVS